jgi:PD-(D/E)XK endonuclease
MWIHVHVCSNYSQDVVQGGKGGWKKRGYQSDVDYFAVYSPDTDKVYLVPAEGIGNQCSLRLSPSKNKQEKHVRYAADYEL